MSHGRINPNSLRQRCVAEVLRRGEATISQIFGTVSRFISATHAVSRARRVKQHEIRRGHLKPDNVKWDDPAHLAEIGKRNLVTDALGDASRRGLIRRTAVGVYASPLPKLYDPPTELAS